MADKAAAAMTKSGVGKLNDTAGGRNYGSIEVYQVRIVGRCSRASDPMRIVADIAGGSFINNMFLVLGKSIVIVYYVVSVVAGITECICSRCFGSIISGQILQLKYARINGTVRPCRSPCSVTCMTGSAIDNG